MIANNIQFDSSKIIFACLVISLVVNALEEQILSALNVQRIIHSIGQLAFLRLVQKKILTA